MDQLKQFEAMQAGFRQMAEKNNMSGVDMGGYPEEQSIPFVPPNNIQYDVQEEEYDNEQKQDYYEERPPLINNSDEEFFPSGPLVSEVESWKKTYDAVYMVDDLPGDDIYIYRTLNRYEYKSIMATQNVDPLMREEMICETCVLFPRDFSYELMSSANAGIPSTLAEQIMETSGFTRASQPRRL